MLVNRLNDVYTLAQTGVIDRWPDDCRFKVRRQGSGVRVDPIVLGKSGRVLRWNSRWDDAENLISMCMETYLMGGFVTANTRVAYIEDEVLYLSFGRQKGHTRAVNKLVEARIDMLGIGDAPRVLIVGSNYQVRFLYKKLIGLGRADFTTVNTLENQMRGRRYDVVIFEAHSGVMREVNRLLPLVKYYSDHQIITCSDAYGEFHWKSQETQLILC